MHYADGSFYTGGWFQGKRQGKGLMTYKDEGKYTGLWAGDMRNGYGVMNFPDRSVYAGNWADDRMQGPGKMTAADGMLSDVPTRVREPVTVTESKLPPSARAVLVQLSFVRAVPS